MHKIERLVNLVALLLESRRPLTLDEIRDKLGAYAQDCESARRMFERDKRELREAGIPIAVAGTDAWELEQGYLIPKKLYRPPDLNLTPAELAALRMAALAWEAGAGGRAAAAVPMVKLAMGSGVDVPSARPWITPRLVGGSEQVERLLPWVCDRREIQFAYRAPGRDPEERHVAPYALVHRHGAWYVVGRDLDRDGMRSFRLSRFEGVTALMHPAKEGPEFDVPEGFDARSTLPSSPGGESPTIRARVRARGDAANLLALRNPVGSREDLGNDEAILDVEVGDREAFLRLVLSQGEAVEVVEPHDLRVETRQRLSRLREVLP